MPASQSGKNMRLAFKVQSALGTLSSGAGATGLDVRPSQGLKLNIAQATSGLIRRDGMSVKPRQGSRSVNGSYETELIVDALDDVFQAMLRGTWIASADITQATMTSITTTTSTIVAAAGSWITQGVRKGMMVKLAGHSTAANNGIWLPVLGVTALTITVPAVLTTDAAPDSTFTLTVARQLIQGDPPTERYFTIEQYMQDIDLSVVAQDCKFNALTFTSAPNQPVAIGFDVVGRDLDIFTAGNSPTFSSPAFVTANPLYLADGQIFINGTPVVNITGFKFSLSMSGGTVPVIGSRLSPDVYLGNAMLSGEFVGTIEDDTYLNYAQAETQLAIVLRCSERESDPADFVTFYLGNLSALDFNLPFGQDDAMIQTIPLVGGKDEGGATSGFAPTMVMISTSAS